MPRHLGFTFLSLLFLSLSAWAIDFDACRKVAVSVVRVVALSANGVASTGSGVVLPGDRVVTNCHVTRGASRLSVIVDGQAVEVREEVGDSSADICVLNTGTIKTPAVRIGASRSLQLGDDVVAVGFGGGLARSLTPGKVTGLFPYRDALVIRSTAAFRLGASGGALLDRHGNLVGVITFFRRGTSDYAFFALPVEWVDRLPLSASSQTSNLTPFWALLPAQQPRFLQVASFEADGNWYEMEAAAREWTREEPRTAPAWEALGRALISEGQRAEGTAALERAETVGASNSRSVLVVPAN
jgi:serine protease Do